MSLLEFRDVEFKKGEPPTLAAVNFKLEPGDVVAAFGRSGSGKHELIQLAAGVLQPTRGKILIEDPRPGEELPMGYVLNEGGLINNMTLLDNAILPAVYHWLMPLDEARRKGAELFESFGLAREAGLRPASVGHSARRLAQIARALLVSPPLLVLDDPFEEVDAEAAQRIRGVLDGIRAERKAAVLIAAGNLGPYLSWATKFLWVRRGGVEVFEGRDALKSSDAADLKVFFWGD